MRFLLTVLWFSFSLVFVSFNALADTQPLDIISVSGKGSVNATPEIAHISLRFEDIDFKVDIARQNVESQVKSLLKKLKRFDIQDQSLDTSQITISPQYDYNRNTRTLRGYQVSRRIQMTLSDLEQLADLVSAISVVGPTALEHIQFDVNDRNRFEKLAMQVAMDQSISTAESIANAYGVQLGSLHQAQYGTQNPIARPMLNSRAVAFESAVDHSSFEQKSLEFTATIQAAFHIN